MNRALSVGIVIFLAVVGIGLLSSGGMNSADAGHCCGCGTTLFMRHNEDRNSYGPYRKATSENGPFVVGQNRFQSRPGEVGPHGAQEQPGPRTSLSAVSCGSRLAAKPSGSVAWRSRSS